MNKNPGFVSNKSQDALQQNINVPNPLAIALIERRKKSAMKRLPSQQETDDNGIKVQSPETVDDT